MKVTIEKLQKKTYSLLWISEKIIRNLKWESLVLTLKMFMYFFQWHATFEAIKDILLRIIDISYNSTFTVPT